MGSNSVLSNFHKLELAWAHYKKLELGPGSKKIRLVPPLSRPVMGCMHVNIVIRLS